MACKYLHFSPSYTVNDSSTQVVFGFPSAVSASDKDKFCLKIVTPIPTGTSASYSAYVAVNGANIPLLNKYGNPVLVSDLAQNVLYKGYYGASTAHVILTNNPRTYNCACNNIL